MTGKYEISKVEHDYLLSESFFYEMSTRGYDMSFRLDQFNEIVEGELIYFGLYAEKICDETLVGLEKRIEKLKPNDAIKIRYPKAVGLIPYEQASEFLPLGWENPQEDNVCFLPKVLLAVSKLKYEIHLINLDEENYDTHAILSDIYDICDSSVIRLNFQQVEPSGTEKHDVDFERYEKAFEITKDHIFSGDIFQLVLSEKFKFKMKETTYQYYLEAVMTYDLPYNAYLNVSKDKAYAITSPEMLVCYDAKNVYTRPIAGTRPIKKDGKDTERQQELMHDAKENAEHLMLVDLGRNDLSKVCIPGTVGIGFYKEVRPYHKVYHMVSEVMGSRNFTQIFDPIRAAFPAGTVSGAPKIRAMQIIKKLEKEKRGSYAGATYVLDSNDEFQSCINIRSASFDKGLITIQVGSGIVYDAVPQDEYKELVNKIRGPLEKFGQAQTGGLSHVSAH